MLGWKHSGFSLVASRVIPAGQRDRLEKLIRYMARHPFNPESIRYDPEKGTVTYQASRRHPTRNTRTIETDAVEFIGWLAQHIPHFRRHQVRFYAAASPKVRKRLGLSEFPPARLIPKHIAKRGARSWSRLIWKVFGIDPLRCPRCGSERRLISVILQDDVIVKILSHLGLPTELPRLQPARGPPWLEPDGGEARDPLPDYDCVDLDYSEWDCMDELPTPSPTPIPPEPPEKRSMGLLEIMEKVPGLMWAPKGTAHFAASELEEKPEGHEDRSLEDGR